MVLLYPGRGLLPLRALPIQHYAQLASGLITDGYGIGIIGVEESTLNYFIKNPLLAELATLSASPVYVKNILYRPTKGARFLTQHANSRAQSLIATLINIEKPSFSIYRHRGEK